MLNGDIGRYRSEELVRSGEAHPSERSIVAGRARLGPLLLSVAATVVAMLRFPGTQ